jgi:hypothetical protein
MPFILNYIYIKIESNHDCSRRKETPHGHSLKKHTHISNYINIKIKSNHEFHDCSRQAKGNAAWAFTKKTYTDLKLWLKEVYVHI